MRLSKKIAALAITATVAVTASAAFAYWTQDGSGDGSATTGTTRAVTVNQTSVIADLYPGQAPLTLSGNFDNPNSGPVKVGSVTATVDTFSVQGDPLKPACTEADFDIGGSAAVNAEIASGNDVGSWSGLTIQLKNAVTNQDNCKGLSSVALSYSVSPAA